MECETTPLANIRQFCAEFIVRNSGSTDEALISAFSSVRREDFVGPGPWMIAAGSEYLSTPDADSRSLYQDFLVGLSTDRGINNGQPTLHALCLSAARPIPGEFAVHIGAGTGYYTAILSHLVGTTGHVLAFEIEPDLAEKAELNLRPFSNLRVQSASGSTACFELCDLIYVCAGATHPPESWLNALSVGGRLVFPLTTEDGSGVMIKITRVNHCVYQADIVTRVAFIPCVGVRDDMASASLSQALEDNRLKQVRSLRRGTSPDATAWCIGNGWWLSTALPN